jgi:hypothetical protein
VFFFCVCTALKSSILTVGISPTTLTVAVLEDVLPEASTAVKVTVFSPISLQVNLSLSKESVKEQLSNVPPSTSKFEIEASPFAKVTVAL